MVTRGMPKCEVAMHGIPAVGGRRAITSSRRWLECESPLLGQWDVFPRISWATCVNLTLANVLEVYSSSKGAARCPDVAVHGLGKALNGGTVDRGRKVAASSLLRRPSWGGR